MRLGGIGSTESAGYVEALGTDGQWAGICDNSFDIFDAHVICKMLGFSTAIEALTNSTADDLYGTAPSGSNFTLDNLDCKGHESSVFHCPPTSELAENCVASKIAGVRCSTSKILKKGQFFSSCYYIMLSNRGKKVRNNFDFSIFLYHIYLLYILA